MKMLLAFPIPSLGFSSARAAHTRPAWHEVSVFGCERMAALTVRLPSILCAWAAPSQYVCSHRDRFKVCWIHARTVAAEVIKRHAFRNRADHHLVSHPMRWVVVLSRVLVPLFETGVAVPRLFARPHPAGFGLVYLCPKSSLSWQFALGAGMRAINGTDSNGGEHTETDGASAGRYNTHVRTSSKGLDLGPVAFLRRRASSFIIANTRAMRRTIITPVSCMPRPAYVGTYTGDDE